MISLRSSPSFRWASLALAAALTACGGGGADTTPNAAVNRLYVMGDSLADVGTFGGLKFTIQGNDTYPERISQAYGLGKGCNALTFTGTTFVANTATSGCTNFAIGGGVINPASSSLTAADPRGIGVQLAAATAAANYTANDMVLIDGGGNDAAALVGAYLKAATDGGVTYTTLLGTVLSSTQVTTAVAGGSTGLATAGATYMSALADQFYTLINTHALNKGAQRVVVLNMPGILNTPRFQAVLDGIALAKGGGTAGATARAQSEALFKSWVESFNSRLASRFAGNNNVVVVDFYTSFNDEVANPTQYGLSNVKTPACPVTGVGTDSLPTYTFKDCTDKALAAAPPSGTTGTDWYNHYAVSDDFHPTPYGHQLLAQLISLSLSRAGWL